MGYKIRNVNFAGKTVAVSEEVVTFDKDGIGELESEHIYSNVLNLRNFSAVEDSKEVFGPKESGDVSPLTEVLTKVVDEKKEEGKDEEEDKLPKLVSADLTHDELDAEAEKLGIEVSGKKEEKVKAINAHIVDNF